MVQIYLDQFILLADFLSSLFIYSLKVLILFILSSCRFRFCKCPHACSLQSKTLRKSPGPQCLPLVVSSRCQGRCCLQPPPLPPPPQFPQPKPLHSHLTYVTIYLTVAEYLKDALRQSSVNLVDGLSNSTSQILVHEEDEFSSYCLILWIKNIPDLCMKPWIGVLDSLQQLPRICWYLIQSPEGHFDGCSKAARCFTSAAFSLVPSLSWNPFRATVSQSTHLWVHIPLVCKTRGVRIPLLVFHETIFQSP